MTHQHTAGPWNVACLERPQLRPYYVVRQISDSHWEQLRDVDGGIAHFETSAEALAAIARAEAA